MVAGSVYRKHRPDVSAALGWPACRKESRSQVGIFQYGLPSKLGQWCERHGPSEALRNRRNEIMLLVIIITAGEGHIARSRHARRRPGASSLQALCQA